MSKQLQRDLDRLLGKIEQTDTTEEVQIETALSVDEEGTPTLHIFLVDDEQENTVEGNLEEEQPDPETDQEQAVPKEEQEVTQEQSIPQHPMSWEYPLWARVISLLGVVVFFGPALLVPIGVSVFQLPVTVMIEPKIAHLELETAITLPARQLSAPILTQSKTVVTTGQGYQRALAAQGLVTLYNALPSPQYVQAGTLITSRSGVQVVTNQGVTIPGGNGATNGQIGVSAHTLSTGKAGNIGAFDINGPCCLAYILAKNTTTFSGGIDARSYPMVEQRDIEQAANDLGASLESSLQGVFSVRLQSGEALTAPSCKPTISSTHKAGEEAKETTIIVALSCGAFAYSTEQFQQALHFELYLYGAEQLNSCYQQRGEATILTLSSKAEGERVTLSVKARASFAYQFTETLFDLYKQAIEGKSKRDARAWLEQQPGIENATLAGDLGSILPTTPSGINLVVVQRGAL